MTISTLDTSIALISLADLKSALGISGTSEDTKLTIFINAASKAIEMFLQRGSLIDSGSDRTEKFDGTGTNIVQVNFPIVSVTTVTVTRMPVGDTTQYTSSGLTLDNNAGRIQIPPKVGTSGRIIDRGTFQLGFQNVEVVYRYGYSSSAIPFDLVQACIMQVAEYRNTPKGGIKSERAGSYAVVYSYASGNKGRVVSDVVAGLLFPRSKIVMASTYTEEVD